MSIFEFEGLHCMGSGLGNCDGSVEIPIEQVVSYNPIYNINAKAAEIADTITVEDSNWDFHFHQRCVNLKKYLCIF